jgi:hypothetical protein
MTDAELWWLTLDFLVLAVIVGGGGYLWARHTARQFDRKYGKRRQPGE